MKKSLFAFLSFVFLFCFISCSNLLEDKNVSENTDKVKVYFAIGSERAIHSSVQKDSYTYTLTGIHEGNQIKLCEKEEYNDFIWNGYVIQTGEWSFELSVYNGNVKIYSATKSATISKGGTRVDFTLHAVTSGTGTLSVKLNYPLNKGVAKVTAKLYDVIPTADSGNELTINSNNCSATFASNSVPSGVNKVLKFYLYDSQNVCIGSYIESVFIINGDYISVERSIANVNTFAATVYLTVNDEAWNDSGCVLKAVKNGKEYLLTQTTAGTNKFTASLPLGVYDIYKNGEDTGVDLTVTVGGNSSATVDLEPVEYYTTPNDIATLIKSLTTDANIIVTGALTAEDFNVIKQAMWSSKYFINLDLSKITDVNSLPNYALECCYKLKSVKLPSSITSLSQGAFHLCTGLEDINIPDSITSIPENAFSGCNKLKTINLPATITEIGFGAFQSCAFETITIPAGVTRVEGDTFRGCNKLKSIDIPETVTYIGDDAFDYCTSLEDISLPDSITFIGRNLFRNCSSLKTIEIPESVTIIKDTAFANCTSLESIEIPNSVTKIECYAFNHCTNLKQIKLPTSPITIEYSVFMECGLETLEIPDNVSINGDNFSYCNNLKSIIVSQNNTNYYSEDGVLFSKDKKTLIRYPCANERTTYAIPNSVETIENYAFAYCKFLNSLTIPNSVKEFKSYVFKKSESFTSLDIPNSVTKMGNYVFSDAKNLKNIKLSNSLKTLSSNLFGNSDVVEIEVPDSVERIEERAFSFCPNLERVIIPDSVVEIGARVFISSGSLKTIEFTDPTIWYRTQKYADWQAHKNGINTDVTDSSANVTAFKNTYNSDYWYKSKD